MDKTEPMQGDVTKLLEAIRAGDATAEGRLLELVLVELKRIARRLMSAERAGHTLQPTALVNELWVQLLAERLASIQDRGHLFAVAAQAMRRILVDYARAVKSQKRGGERQRVDLEFAPVFSEENIEEIVEMDLALERLEKLDARQCRIVEMRFFVGLSEEEIAELMGISVRTVKRDWRVAKAWLHAELSGEG
jgi:RNA polymerase sigma factor (TIGR02999 family)